MRTELYFPKPVKYFSEIKDELDKRIFSGWGSSEYDYGQVG
jgi:hypothetical protein